MDLKEEDILGDNIYTHWYYTSKSRALSQFLSDIKVQEVLDVGAGSGVFSRHLLDEGTCQSAVCVDPYYPTEKNETHNGKPITFVKQVKKSTQELILMMDVLEHVQDDTALLNQYVDNMNTGSHVLITVPAFQFMWSGHDVFLEHFRRYTINSTEKLVKNSGLTPIKSRYFFGSLFPLLAIIRLSKKMLFKQGTLKAHSDLKNYPNWLNTALTTIHDLERYSLFKFNKMFGLSVFILCRKG